MASSFFSRVQVIACGAMAVVLVFGWVSVNPMRADAAPDEDVTIAMSLAETLRAGRTVISNNQELINNPNLGDKGLSGDAVLSQAIKIYQSTTGIDLNDDAIALGEKLEFARPEGSLGRFAAQLVRCKSKVHTLNNNSIALGLDFQLARLGPGQSGQPADR